MFKIIYLSIHFSYVGLDVRLDYDNINTILLFSKKTSLLFALWNCTLVFFFFWEKKLQSFIFIFIFLIVVLLSFINFLDKFLGVFDCMVENF